MKATIHEGLIVGLGHSDALQNVVKVVGGDAITGTLREERGQDDEQQALPVAGSLDKNTPTILLVQLLQLDRLTYFSEFRFDKIVLCITAGVKLRVLC